MNQALPATIGLQKPHGKCRVSIVMGACWCQQYAIFGPLVVVDTWSCTRRGETEFRLWRTPVEAVGFIRG